MKICLMGSVIEKADPWEKLEDCYLIRNESGGKRVRLGEILYLTKDKKYVIFHGCNGQEYKERSSLREVYKNLPNDLFVAVEKGYIINMQWVRSWTGTLIELDGGADLIAIPVSRRMRAEAKAALSRFWSED